MQPEWKSRVNWWLSALEKELYEPLGDIALEGFLSNEALPADKAAHGPFSPMRPGDAWGRAWQYCWLKGRFTLPEAARGQRIVFDAQPGGEATIYLNGEAFGTRRAEWVTQPHHYICDQWVTLSGEPGAAYELLMEAYAGHSFPGCATGPVVEGVDRPDGIRAEPRACLGRTTFGIWHEEAYQLYMDARFLNDMLKVTPDASLLTAQIEEALQRFTLDVDFEQPRAKRLEDYKRARKALAGILSAHNGTIAPEMYAVGNAHLDICWLWPYQETRRKVARTFAQQIRLMELYPEYTFIQSQPESYQICKEDYPALFEKVKEKIKGGQWIAEGGMWVEPDTNMSGGEALIRQLIHGKRFYRDELGVDCQLLWLPDTFGYSAALPQILLGCGIKYLTTQKIFWSYNGGDRFPYHDFVWQGMDGSQVNCFLHMDYTSDTAPDVVVKRFEERVQRQKLTRFLLPFGYGDGGGGPCRDHIENALRERDMQGVPRVRFSSPNAFFEDSLRAGAPEHTYVGELYFQCHRGTYTSQAAIKKYNRLCEQALRETEMWCAAAADKIGYPAQALDQCWKTALRCQFHDILPGSSIARVYEDARAWYQDTLRTLNGLKEKAQRALTDGEEGTAYFNSLSWPRKWLIKEGEGHALITLPPCGYTGKPVKKTRPDHRVSARIDQMRAVLSNGLVEAVINRNGEIESLWDLETDRALLGAPGNVLHLYKDVPRKFDAWDIDSMYESQPVALTDEGTLTLLSCDDWRASVRVERRIHNSLWIQEISLQAEDRQLSFQTHVDWHEQHKLLKAAFPTGLHADEGYNEVQFGFVKRPTHRSRPYDADRFEVCNHRYTALAEANAGAAVLNDCKYGCSMLNDTIALTLLRAATAPDPHADVGEHDFSYAYYTWNGSFMDGQVARRGYEFNIPVTAARGRAPERSLLTIDQPNVILETVKAAEDGSGDIVLRLYEAMNARTRAALTLRLGAGELFQTDMLEQNARRVQAEKAEGGLRTELTLRAFEVVTLRFRRA